MRIEDREAFGIAVGALGSIGAAAALVAVRDSFDTVNVALILVLMIVLGAVIGGRRAGIVSAIVAGASLDFFHTQPYNSLKIADAADIETTVLLIVVGIAVGEIALRSERIRSTFRDERYELQRIHRVAQLAAAGDSIDDVVASVTAELTETLHLTDCYFEKPPFTEALPRMEPTGTILATHHRYTGQGFELPAQGVELPVKSGEVVLGRFVLRPTPGVGVSLEHKLVAVTLADQMGVVLGRAAAP